ncbi:MAG: tyrosine-type recombinase/integrase [Nitrosopumilaceae archaeon]
MNQKQGSNAKHSIYDYDDRIRRTYNLIKRDLSKDNHDLVKRYDKEMLTQGLGKAVRHKNLQIVLNLSRLLGKDWMDASKDDIENLVIKIIELYADKNGQETYTSYDHKKILKMFFRWLKLGSREQKQVGDPPETKSIRIKKVKDKISREDLLTESDLTRLLHCCGDHLRDKAFIDCHFEAGTRPGEILNLQIKHVELDKLGAILKVDGKTGARTIRLIKSVPNLHAWLNNHPMKNNPDAPLWINQSVHHFGEPLSYPSVYQMMKRRCKQAGLSKRVYPNLFRHTAATSAANFMTEAQMRARHGWTPYSKMPGRYVHLNNADVEEAILAHYGLSNKKEEQKQKLPKLCQICDTHNSHDETVCIKCARPLDLQTALKLEEEDNKQYESVKDQMAKMKEELEDLKYGAPGRGNRYNKVRLDASDSPAMKIFAMGIPLLLEMLLPEEKKRAMMKEFEKAELENRKPDLHAIFGIQRMTEGQVRLLRESVTKYRKEFGYSKPENNFKPRFRIENLEAALSNYD